MTRTGAKCLFAFILAVCLVTLQSCGAGQNTQNGTGGGPTFIQFTVPGGGTQIDEGTYPTKINATGLITGYVADSNLNYHGFLRNHKGAITVFDVPGAKGGYFLGTMPQAINTSGTVAGTWADQINGNTHGFYRILDGTITNFDLPAGFSGISNLTMNDSGVIAGTTGNSSQSYGFIRATDGTITTFNVGGASSLGTIVTGINSNGDTTGYFFVALSVGRGFLRTVDGTVTEFDAPGNSPPCACSTQPTDISDSGAIVGATIQGFHQDSFLRAPDGTFTVFDPPQAGGNGSYATAINGNGVVAGVYRQPFIVGHTYIRNLDGTFTTVDAPHTPPQTGSAVVTSINASGAVVGITGEYPILYAVGFLYQP